MLNTPTPQKISYFWNYGSLLGFCLLTQILSGLFLCFSYTANSTISFLVIDYIVRDIINGDIIRKVHAKGATIFFFFLYLHTGRNIYFNSFKKKIFVWNTGIVIFLIRMAIAFFGYVLPWGQMSYWGATVITNLFSVFPLIGKIVVEWLWGGFSVNKSTLTRFFGLHIVLPLILCLLVFLHLVFLHFTGSSNPIGIKKFYLSFHPYWTIKDMVTVFISLGFLSIQIFLSPFFFMDSENFLEANFMVTPVHIQPEWYFLPAYAVLRSIPKKLGGVIGLLMVFLIFFFKPMFSTNKFFNRKNVKYIYWFWVSNIIGLLWIGSCVVEGLFIFCGQIFRFFYFFLCIFL